jgi:hypothetical protein
MTGAGTMMGCKTRELLVVIIWYPETGVSRVALLVTAEAVASV